MKKYYNCPATEDITINATYNLCAVSTTENFSIIEPGTNIGADEGR